MRAIRPNQTPKKVNRIGFVSCGDSDLVAEFLNSGVKDQSLGPDGDFDTHRRLKDEFIYGVDRSNVSDGSGESHIFLEVWNGDRRQIEIEHRRPWTRTFDCLL